MESSNLEMLLRKGVDAVEERKNQKSTGSSHPFFL
jgi:hypothetical protein